MQLRFVSYLDLMCCGFGGALLMFLIVASARERIESSEPMLFVRCRVESGEKSTDPIAGAELGIEYRRAGTKDWIRANGPSLDGDIVGTDPGEKRGEKWAFLPTTAPGQPAEALLVCRYPRPGQWEFRAYLADFPADDSPDRAISVAFEFLGAVQSHSTPHLLLTPGTSTPIVPVEIRTTRS